MVKFLIFGRGVQEFHGAAELGAEPGLVAVEAFEAAAIVYQMLVGDGGAGLAVADVVLFADLGFLASDLVIHKGGLEGQDAVVAPAGGDQLIDEVEPGAGLGLVLGEVFFAKGVELLLRFAFVEELVRGESVGEAGGAGAGASLGGDGSAGFGAVGAGGIDAFLGGHGGSLERGFGHRDLRRAWDEGNAGEGAGRGVVFLKRLKSGQIQLAK